MTNQLFDLTVNDIRITLNQESNYQARRKYDGDRNAIKKIALCDRLLAILANLDGNIVFESIEGVRGNGERKHIMLNAGTLVEIALTAYRDNQAHARYSKAFGLYDGNYKNGVGYQVKASLTSYSLSTPSASNDVTYCVNSEGVYRVPASHLQDVLDKNGRVMYKGIPSQYLHKTLTTLMGY